MAKIRVKNASLSSDSSVNAPTFRFMSFEPNKRLENNQTNIDFITDGKSLYVCAIDGGVTGNTIGESAHVLLKIVSQGERGENGNPGRDGEAGVVPEIGAEYIDLGGEKKLALTVDGRRKAMTGDLTPPVYVPVLEDDRYLTWEWSNEDPAVIDLMKLRPLHDRPILLRTNSDNTKREAESCGPANFIQWKYEGDEYWTNLISIQELMNLAFAGMATWEASDGKWHFGYREVLKATYDSNKAGRRVISRVDLGDVLFDAGELPLNDYEVDIELLNQRLEELEGSIVKSVSINNGQKFTPDDNGNVNLPIDLSDYAEKDWVEDNFQPKGNYVEGIQVNDGPVETPDRGGIVRLTIDGGESSDDSDCVKSVEINGDEKFPVNGKVSFNLDDKYNKFDLIYRNDGHLVKIINGVETDLGEFNPSGEGDGVGVDNIEFRINYSIGKLEFRMSVDGDWKSWIPIDLPDSYGGSGDGVGISDLDFRLHNGILEYQVAIDGEPQGWEPIDLPSGIAGDGVGIDDIKFELQNGQLKYQVSIDGEWQGVWNPIPLPGGTTGGEHVDLQITSAGMLQIRYDGGQWQDIGLVNSGSDLPNAFVNVSITNNKLTFTRNNGTTQVIDLPETGSDGSVVSVQQILGSGVHIATITVDGTPVKIYAPKGGSVDPDDPDPEDPDQPSTVSYRTFMVYQRTNSPTEAPSTETITAAVWNLSTQELDLTSEYWNNHPGNAHDASDSCLWMTSATFSSEYGARISDWEEPVCLTSSWGDGADSNKKEFIYRSLTDAEYEVLKSIRPVKAIDDNRDDNFPPADVLAERQWVDTPVGITPDYPYEIGSYRRRVDGVWQEYSMPFVWSHWGEDGVDGDGVEYVYRRAVADEVNEADNSITLKVSVERPSNSWEYDSAVAPWTDDPSGVSSEYPYEFCAQRKTVIVDNAMVWGPWSEPALWGIYKEGPQGPQGPGGGPGPAGPRGDDYEKVYGLAGNALPASKSIDATQEDANGKTSADDGYLPKFVFDGVSIDATATPSGVSESNRYEYESVRRKHDGVWGPFSAPALHSNFVEAGLTDEQLENIKNDVEAAVGQDIADAQQRITNAENRLNNLDDEVTGVNTEVDDLTGRVTAVEARAVYDDEDIKALAEVVIDAKKASIVAEADANTDGKINVVNQTLNALDGRITSTADSLDEVSGELNTVKTDLNAAEASIALAATKAELNGDIASVRQDMSADKAELQTAVMKGKYVWVKYDGENVVDVAEYNGESSKPGYDLEVLAEAMTAIRQSANEVDIVANWGDDTWSQIVAKADPNGSSIVLDADHINLSGTTDATKAVIGEATITDATITNGTITNATINDCTINSSIVSDNYDNVNKTGFMLNPENNEFALYSDGVKFDSTNGLNLGSSQVISWNNLDSGVQDAINNAGGSDIDSTLVTKINQWSVQSDTIIANNLKAKNIDAEYLTIGGDPISASNSLDIVFGNASMATDSAHTIYFLY